VTSEIPPTVTGADENMSPTRLVSNWNPQLI